MFQCILGALLAEFYFFFWFCRLLVSFLLKNTSKLCCQQKLINIYILSAQRLLSDVFPNVYLKIGLNIEEGEGDTPQSSSS